MLVSRYRQRCQQLCQQLLAVAVVGAALVPASRVVSLDVVGVAPEAGRGAGAGSGGFDLALRAYQAVNEQPSLVATAPGEAVVRDVALTAPAAPAGARGRVAVPPKGLVSAPQDVEGLGTVGITWDEASAVLSGGISIEVRSRTAEGWSTWESLEYEAGHGPDPDSVEGRRARPGTEAVVVGDVDQVQVRAAAGEGRLPHDLTLSVIEPGAPVPVTEETAAIDTADLAAGRRDDVEGDPVADAATVSDELGQAADETEQETDEEAFELATTTVTPKPVIFSRAQWGANEKLRSGGSLRYFEVHGGFVHHTVNANNYAPEDVPALLRSIYAYHTRSRGWSDVGYNFLVDRFGRIWEGRYGGVDRAVVGAHTLNYNDYAFAMSAIGNFEQTKPSKAMRQAYAALFAWKLSLHGVRADATTTRIGSKNFSFSINGHRDAGSTACPGHHLYRKIPKIRKLAAALQADWSGRELQASLVSTPVRDLVLRRASDRMGVIVPLRRTEDGRILAGDPVETGLNLKRNRAVLSVGDWDRDGFNDLVTQSRQGALQVRRGNGKGSFAGPPIKLSVPYSSFSLLTAAGDVTGDGYPDLLGQPQGGGVRVFPGAGSAGVASSYPAYGAINASLMAGVGRWNSDGTPDVVVRRGDTLTVWGSNGPGGLTGPIGPSMDVGKYDWILGAGITGLSGHPDLIVKKAGKNGLFVVPGSATGFGKPVKVGRGFKKYDLVG